MYIEDTNIDMSIIDTHAPIDIFWEVITGCYPIRGESGSWHGDHDQLETLMIGN